MRRWGTTTVTLGHPKDSGQDFVDTSFLGRTPADTPWLLYPWGVEFTSWMVWGKTGLRGPGIAASWPLAPCTAVRSLPRHWAFSSCRLNELPIFLFFRTFERSFIQGRSFPPGETGHSCPPCCKDEGLTGTPGTRYGPWQSWGRNQLLLSSSCT